MQTLRISSKLTLCFGLTWEQYDPYSGSEHAQIVKWRADGYTQAARYKHPGGRVYGLHRPSASGNALIKADTTLISVAGVIATHPKLHNKTGLVLLSVEDESRGQWMICVGLRSGAVVLDRLVTPDQVSVVRNDFLKDHTPGEALETWGDTSTGQIDHPFLFEELTPSRGGGQAVALKILASSRWPKAVGIVAVTLLVSAGAVYAWLSFAEESAKRKAMQELSRQTPQAIYQAEIDKWLVRPVNMVPEALELMWSTFKAFPTDHAGWTLVSIACAPTPSKQCAVVWLRKDGTLQEFRAAAPSTWQGISPMGQDGISMSVELAMPEVKLDRTTWPAVSTYRDALLSHWQFLAPGGWQATMAGVVKQAVPANFNAEQLAAIANMPGAPLGMAITVKNMAWDLADPTDPDSPTALSQLGRAVELTGPIEITFDGKRVVFSFTGTAYVQ